MCDLFVSEDVRRIFHNKFVVVLGDSVQRGVYKDLVMLLQNDHYLTESDLKRKGELSHWNDQLLEGGQLGEMTNGRNYREVRQYHTDTHLIRFYFLTRCYGDYIETVLEDLQEDPQPDLIIMNSCLWDISRYGPSSVNEYKKNLVKLFTRFQEVLPEDCLVVWNTTLPIGRNIRGGFMIPRIEFMNETLRLDILEANFFASQVVVDHGYDVLDLHYYFRQQIHRRVKDGVHWDYTAHRRMSNYILTHICEAWGVPLPCRNKMFIQDRLAEIENLKKQGFKGPDDCWIYGSNNAQNCTNNVCENNNNQTGENGQIPRRMDSCYGGNSRRPHHRSLSVDPSSLTSGGQQYSSQSNMVRPHQQLNSQQIGLLGQNPASLMGPLAVMQGLGVQLAQQINRGLLQQSQPQYCAGNQWQPYSQNNYRGSVQQTRLQSHRNHPYALVNINQPVIRQNRLFKPLFNL